jgi:guanine deaminase
MAETPAVTHAVLSLFPGNATYLDVYEKYGLIGPRFSGGHSIWLNDESFRRLSKQGASVTFCPASNLFLGSGLFRIGKAKDPKAKVRMAMGSDMGGGNYFCMLNVLGDAYKVGMLNNTVLLGSNNPKTRDTLQADRNKFSAYRGLYSITLGGAEALYLDDKIGNFNVDKAADFVVLDTDAGPPQLPWHQSLYGGPGAPKNINDCANKFFSLMVLGDDRAVDATYVYGKLAYKKGAKTLPPAQ